jgi:hypothetical protein
LKVEGEKVPSIGISLSVALDEKNQRSIVFQTYVDQEMPYSKIAFVVDKMLHVADRAEARYEMPALQANLEQHINTLADLKRDLNQVDARHQEDAANSTRRGGFKLSPKDEQHREQVLKNVAQYERMVDRLKRDVEVARKKSDASPSAADSLPSG